jgi:hypothetical protein
MKTIALAALLFVTTSVNAVWINATGKVEEVWTYATNNTVLVKLSVAGRDVEECSNKTMFAISKGITEEARSRMYSMLLSAQSKGNLVTVSFNDVGSCESWDADPAAFRKIYRVINKA